MDLAEQSDDIHGFTFLIWTLSLPGEVSITRFGYQREPRRDSQTTTKKAKQLTTYKVAKRGGKGIRRAYPKKVAVCSSEDRVDQKHGSP